MSVELHGPDATPRAAHDVAEPSPCAWGWQVAEGRAALDRHAPAWNALAAATGASLFSDAFWIRPFCDAFLLGETVRLHLLARGEALAAVLPLRRTGRALPTWRVLANSHTPGPPLVVDARVPDAWGLALDHLLGSAAVLDFGRVPVEGALCRELTAAARRRRLRVALKPTDGEAILDLPATWDALRAALSRSLRKNTERSERKLDALGRVSFEVVQGAPALAGALEECFDLETRGWKGERGSPIRSSASVLRFYTDLAAEEAAAGRFALYTLRLDSRLVAFEYCLRAGGRIALLKISFDPALARHSPGQVLRLKILRREVERGEVHEYSMGPQSQWKLHWATRVEPVCRLRIYGRGLRGRAAWLAGPGTRAVLGRSDTVRRLVRRVRAAAEARRRRRRHRGSAPAR
jgi:CelD/BcsL family acetyltransferase involved in cellulose biosynthesis